MNMRRSAYFLLVLSVFSAAPPVAAQTLILPGKAGPGKGKKVVLISGDEEYRSEEALPMLAKVLSQHHGFDCTVLFSIDPENGYIDPNNQKSLPGMKALDDADLMIVATRFRTPPAEEMKHFEAYLDAGKPVIGLRTATHGFRGKWGYFGMQILGERWAGHHGGHKREGCRGVVEKANAGHPILRGVTDVFAPSDVYGVSHLTPKATILLRGAVTRTLDPSSENLVGKKNNPMQALAWLKDYTSKGGGRGKTFCTTMGASVDFCSAGTRRLVVNAAFHLTGLDVPRKANVDTVDPYDPSFYGFIKGKNHWRKRNLRPSDFGLGKALRADDPPGSPKWPFRQAQPSPPKLNQKQGAHDHGATAIQDRVATQLRLTPRTTPRLPNSVSWLHRCNSHPVSAMLDACPHPRPPPSSASTFPLSICSSR